MKKNRRIKAVLTAVLILYMFFSSGCWDYREFENLALVSALGYDTEGSAKQVTVTMQYYLPDGSSSQQGSGAQSSTGTAVVKATGRSIDEALTKIQQIVEKRLFYGYMEEIVLGESAAKTITKDVVAFADRTPNVRTSSYIVVSADTAEKVLNISPSNSSEPPGKIIHSLIDQSLSSGNAYPVTIQSFISCLAENGKEALVPRITATIKGSTNSSGTSSGSSGSSSSLSSGSSSNPSGDSTQQEAVLLDQRNTGYLRVDGLAAFKKEKLTGWLDGKEALGSCWIEKANPNPYEVINTAPPKKQDVNDTMVFRVTSSNCKVKINTDSGSPSAEIDEYVESDLRKFSANVNFSDFTTDAIGWMEKQLASNVKADLKAAVDKSQKVLKSDVLGIGRKLYQQNPQLWHAKYEKNWDQIYPDLPISIKVTARVIDTGTSTRKFK